jgi:hypothetical protein
MSDVKLSPDTGKSSSSELSRTLVNGTVWFSAASISTAIVFAGLLSTGWRPTALPALDAALWWIGLVVGFAGVAAIGWAGCPIYSSDSLEVEAKRKSVSIRAGMTLFLIGTAFAGVAVLTG